MFGDIAKNWRFIALPILYFISIILTIVALAGPSNRSTVNLVSVFPATAASQLTRRGVDRVLPRAAAVRLARASDAVDTTPTSIDGRSLSLGPLRSCSRSNNTAPWICSKATFSPLYEYTPMYNGSNGKTCPPTTLSFIAYAPPATAAILLSSIVASSVFLFLHFFTTFPDREWLTSPSKFESIASHTITAHLTAWSGVGSFVMGLIGTIIWHSIFATRVQDFNEKIASLGGNSGKSPQLIAEIGSGFTYLWVAWVFAAPAVIDSIIKIQRIAVDNAVNGTGQGREKKRSVTREG